MNKVVLIGRLTKDPETKPAGETTRCAFTLAVDRQGKEKEADFIRITAFGKTAEIAGKWLYKGKQTAIDGHIRTGSYDDADGKRVYTTDVIAERIELLGSKQDAQPVAPEEPHYEKIDDDDIPF